MNDSDVLIGCSVEDEMGNSGDKQQQHIRVQSVAQNCKLQVPPQYIQLPQHQPKNAAATAAFKSIPIIDLGSSRTEICGEVGQACREWGAFHVINHGLPIQLLDDVRRVGMNFFEDCPMTDKLTYSCDSNSNSSFAAQGYGSRMLVSDDSVLDWRDYFDHHTLPLSRRNPSRWPHFPPNYRQIIAEYSNHMNALAKTLLSLVSESVGLPSSRIEEAVGEFYQNITISYYPPCPQPDLTLGLQAHSDMGAITLLIQHDVMGLQVIKDGEWINVHPLPDAIVVLLADQTEIITNGLYRSAQHRAITNASKARLSVATFHDPAKTTVISPASELITGSSLPQYRQVTYGDYVSSWYTKGPEGKRNLDGLLI